MDASLDIGPGALVALDGSVISPRGPDETADALICRLEHRQRGTAARRQLLVLGVSSKEVSARVGRSLWCEHRGVYAVGRRDLTPQGRSAADLLACGPDAFLNRVSALAHIGFTERRPTATQIAVPTQHRRRRRSARAGRSRAVEPGEIALVDGLPVTCWSRTLVDCAPLLPRAELTRAVEAAMTLRIYDHPTMCAALEGRAWPGTPVLRSILDELADEEPPTRKAFEDAMRDLLREAGLPTPAFNVMVHGAERDLVYRDLLFVIELDGHRFHVTASQRARDAERDLELATLGWATLRLRWRQVRPGPERARTAAKLRATLRARASLLGLPRPC